MTQQAGTDRERGDRPALEAREKYDRIGNEALKSFERVQNTLTLEGCAFSEAYVEGRLRIVLEYSPYSLRETDGGERQVVLRHDGEVFPLSSPSSIGQDYLHLTNLGFNLSADENVMLIGNVEPVDTIEVVPSVLERFDIIQNAVDDGIARSNSLFLSPQVGFRTLPISVEWKSGAIADGATVGFDERTVTVVKGRSEIMNRVAHDQWSVLWNGAPESSHFPLVLVKLGIERLDVICRVSPDNLFKLRDVMIGPFYF